MINDRKIDSIEAIDIIADHITEDPNLMIEVAINRGWNTTGAIFKKLGYDNMGTYEIGMEHDLTFLDKYFHGMPDLDDITLKLEFSSVGHSDPGSMHGGPLGVGHAPEYLDDRQLRYAELNVNGKSIPIKESDVLAELEAIYQYDIESTELEQDNY